MSFEITIFRKNGDSKNGNLLSKRIALCEDGSVKSDGSHCRMTQGTAHRVKIDDFSKLAAVISRCPSNEALALGRLRDGVIDGARVVTRKKLGKVARDDVIARTKEHIMFIDGETGVMLLDIDVKGMPDHVKRTVEAAGGVFAAICLACPELLKVTRIVRQSTSWGIRDASGREYPGSGGQHIFLLVNDVSLISEFLKRLRDLLWLKGLSWYSGRSRWATARVLAD